MAESVVKPLAKDLAAAVKHLHSLSIVHRDIKLENAYVRCSNDFILWMSLIDFSISFQLVTRYDGRLSLKIGDFGEAVCATEPLYEFTGTKLYMAPELWLKIGYGLKVSPLVISMPCIIIISRPRKFTVLKMAKYGLKNMLIWSKNSEIWPKKQKKFKLRFSFIDKYSCHFVDLDDLRNTVSSFLVQIIYFFYLCPLLL